ncbi:MULTISPECIES: hypothetical protein [Acinetobacter]|uniref:hypothetical protein n=1 Tax=Acinetobacter TaxID=469 RepID=UPI0005542093|nr:MULTISPECIES: hypothetical protein [Acinetobacter]MCK4079187.1 hypothetical protein [Acinetobacter radioresistens]MCK4085407.1 hypothetical protein [Acinetobacter radioresistens]MCX0338230.1 hypothetical protein [Acinetobacter radioresistens]MCX0347114.1 hypothetical protein [Acinetobacter radioresistens]NTY96974.1 hypothetical protein [Acinetobacter radioresistens]
MNYLTPSDLLSVQQLFQNLLIFSLIVGMFISAIIYSFYLKIVRAINVPSRIKTETGYLYRAHNGLYVTKERKKELLFDLKLKNKQRYIRYHTYILERLESAD